MNILETIRVALSSLKSNKLRSSLTILGIIVGIFSIISISTIISMLQTSIEEGVSALGKNTFQLQKWPIVQMSRSERIKLMRNRSDITLEEFYRLERVLDGAEATAAEMWQGGRVFTFGSKETNPNISVAGITLNGFKTNDWTVEHGREFNNRDIESYAKVIVLGSEVAKTLFDNLSPIGQEVKVNGYKVRVVGVLEAKGAVFGQSQDNFAIIPITTWQSFYGKRRRSVNITVMSPDKASYNDLIEKARGKFRTIRKVEPGEDDDFTVRTNEAILNNINDTTAGVRIGSFVIAGIALLAAGIGIMNIMLVSVTERTREIGIRKSIGAKRKNILNQFLIEAVVLSLLGGIIGIVLGIIVGNIAGSFLNAVAVIPFDWIFIGVSLCVLIGVSFGVYPAYKASNLDPIEALRFE